MLRTYPSFTVPTEEKDKKPKKDGKKAKAKKRKRKRKRKGGKGRRQKKKSTQCCEASYNRDNDKCRGGSAIASPVWTRIAACMALAVLLISIVTQAQGRRRKCGCEDVGQLDYQGIISTTKDCTECKR